MAVTLFVAFVAVVLAMSFYFARRAKSASGYYAAGGNIHWGVNGVAFAGDYLSAASFLGICGMIATVGYDGFLYSIGYLAGWIVALFVVAEPMKRLGKYTFTDALDSKFNSKGIQLAAAISTLIVSVFYLIPQLVGRQNATWMLLSSEWVSAQEAKDMGLVWKLTDPEDLLPEARRHAEHLAAMPISSLIACKRVITEPLRPQIEAARERENAAFVELLNPATADLNGNFYVDTSSGMSIMVTGNGMLDSANELGLLGHLLNHPEPFHSGIRSTVIGRDEALTAWLANLAQLNRDIGPMASVLASAVPGLQKVLAGFLTLGDGEFSVTSAPTPEDPDAPKLIAMVKDPNSTLFQKAIACKKLSISGGREAIAPMAALLSHPQLGCYARFGMEPNPDPSVDEAFRAALPNLKGRLQVGVIHSIGFRKDAKAPVSYTHLRATRPY